MGFVRNVVFLYSGLIILTEILFMRYKIIQ